LNELLAEQWEYNLRTNPYPSHHPGRQTL